MLVVCFPIVMDLPILAQCFISISISLVYLFQCSITFDLCFSDVFSGYKNGTLGLNGVTLFFLDPF